jgi:hypothetical protein
MAIQTVKYDGTLTQEELQTFLNNQEAALGPVTAVSDDGTHTILSSDESQEPPQDQTPPLKAATLATYTEAAPPTKPGNSIVCSGTGYINSKKVRIVVYRPD